MASVPTLPFTGDEAADQLLASDPLALLIGMVLDQQIPMERAFHSPYELRERLGGTLDAATIADMDPDSLAAVFAARHALHRFPGSMAARVQAVCRHLVDHYGGRAENVWQGMATGEELFTRIAAMPGFGKQKAQIFTALLAKRLGVTPPGWEEQAGSYADHGCYSVADVDGPDAMARVREYKRAAKAEAKGKGTG